MVRIVSTRFVGSEDAGSFDESIYGWETGVPIGDERSSEPGGSEGRKISLEAIKRRVKAAADEMGLGSAGTFNLPPLEKRKKRVVQNEKKTNKIRKGGRRKV